MCWEVPRSVVQLMQSSEGSRLHVGWGVVCKSCHVLCCAVLSCLQVMMAQRAGADGAAAGAAGRMQLVSLCCGLESCS